MCYVAEQHQMGDRREASAVDASCCVHQGGEESIGGIGGKPAEVLPPVGAARLSGGAPRADSERRKSAVDFSLSDRVQAVVRHTDPRPDWRHWLGPHRPGSSWGWLGLPCQDPVCSSDPTTVECGQESVLSRPKAKPERQLRRRADSIMLHAWQRQSSTLDVNAADRSRSVLGAGAEAGVGGGVRPAAAGRGARGRRLQPVL